MKTSYDRTRQNSYAEATRFDVYAFISREIDLSVFSEKIQEINGIKNTNKILYHKDEIGTPDIRDKNIKIEILGNFLDGYYAKNFDDIFVNIARRQISTPLDKGFFVLVLFNVAFDCLPSLSAFFESNLVPKLPFAKILGRGTPCVFALPRKFLPERKIVGHFGNINDVAWSSDSRFLATIANDNVDSPVLIWNAKNGEVKTILSSFTGNPEYGRVKFSADCKRLLVYNFPCVQMWDVEIAQILMEPGYQFSCDLEMTQGVWTDYEIQAREGREQWFYGDFCSGDAPTAISTEQAHDIHRAIGVTIDIDDLKNFMIKREQVSPNGILFAQRLRDGRVSLSETASKRQLFILGHIRTLATTRWSGADEPDAEPYAGEPNSVLEVPTDHVDTVHFLVTAPEHVEPGADFVLDVWAHLEDQRDQILKRVREEIGADRIYAKSKGPVLIPHGSVLSVEIRLDRFDIEDSFDTIHWAGESGNASFIVSVPKDLEMRKWPGRAFIYLNGVQILKLAFTIHVLNNTSESTEMDQKQEIPRTAFISYASHDRDRVMDMVRSIKIYNPQFDPFMDVLTLRAGQYWEQKLWKAIPEKDIFYLFWSIYAKRSDWVEKEWRCALETRGLDFIAPVPLTPPDIAPPPKELSAKHFGDLALLVRKERV